MTLWSILQAAVTGFAEDSWELYHTGAAVRRRTQVATLLHKKTGAEQKQVDLAAGKTTKIKRCNSHALQTYTDLLAGT